ncbi:OsmC family protein [Lacticigenium naphthae]|uniref:OsmC family protein n=1 Tax=Lacticigenium naphthae TaxID=515351 RepID=UPI000429167A|nr:OsmC family protein [Lacticigenium naphthae]
MRVETKWQGKMGFVTENELGKSFKMDAVEASGGLGDGVSPMEALLGALAGCTSMDMVAMLRRFVEDGKITDMKVESRAKQNEEHPHYFTDIEMTCVINGDVPADRVWRAFRMSEEKYCSVRNSMKSDVTLKVVLNGEEVPEKN